MFVVIVSTGNHFVLDAIAGAISMGLACALFPLVLALIHRVEDAMKSVFVSVRSRMLGTYSLPFDFLMVIYVFIYRRERNQRGRDENERNRGRKKIFGTARRNCVIVLLWLCTLLYL